MREKIRELQGEIALELKLDATMITRRLQDIAFADPNELTAVVRGACRYCHGRDHLYQHRTEDEFHVRMEAWASLSDAKRAVIRPPDDAGGFGYLSKRPPHSECPMCEGDGEARARVGDTTRLSERGARLFAGVKETQHGIEIKMHDQMGALDSLAKHLGLFKADNEQRRPADAICELIDSVNRRRSRAPIVQQDPEPAE